MSEIVLTTFDMINAMAEKKQKKAMELYYDLLALKERMDKDISRLESIIAGLEHSGGTYPAGRVVELFHNPPPGGQI
jgi:hypothetical protein